jgi:hypothetical protein
MSFENEANCKNEDEYVIRIKKSLSPPSSPPVERRKKKKVLLILPFFTILLRKEREKYVTIKIL